METLPTLFNRSGSNTSPDRSFPGRKAPGKLQARPGVWSGPAIWVFGLLNGADLLLTAWLLGHYEGSVYEANPLARWFLGSSGWGGLIVLKLLAVSVACGVCILVSRRRATLGRRLVTFGCVITGAVVLWSGYLALALDSEEMGVRDETEAVARKLAQQEDYRRCLECVADDLIGSRCSLAEAIRHLAETPRSQDPTWLEALGCVYAVESDQECLAISIVGCSFDLLSTQQSSQGERLAERLADDFRALFGHPLPEAISFFASGRSASVGGPVPDLGQPAEERQVVSDSEFGSSEGANWGNLVAPVEGGGCAFLSQEVGCLLGRARVRFLPGAPLNREICPCRNLSAADRAWERTANSCPTSLFYPAPFP
jgi:hypothetical protein